jgi:hypothetical protein
MRDGEYIRRSLTREHDPKITAGKNSENPPGEKPCAKCKDGHRCGPGTLRLSFVTFSTFPTTYG